MLLQLSTSSGARNLVFQNADLAFQHGEEVFARGMVLRVLGQIALFARLLDLRQSFRAALFMRLQLPLAFSRPSWVIGTVAIFGLLLKFQFSCNSAKNGSFFIGHFHFPSKKRGGFLKWQMENGK